MRTYDAILPAGGTVDATLAAASGTSNKALIKFGDQTILSRTLACLRESGMIRRTVVVGPDDVHQSLSGSDVDILLPAGQSGPDNILSGLQALLELPDKPQKVVVVTTDLPFLTPDMVRDFIASCPPDSDICLPLCSKADYQRRFPNSNSTFVPLKDGVWTAGCLYLLDVEALQRAKPHIDRLFEVRKSKVGMVRVLGFKFLVKFITKTLTVRDIERKIETLLNCSGSAILNSAPELAFDIDYLDDYEYALEHAKRDVHR